MNHQDFDCRGVRFRIWDDGRVAIWGERVWEGKRQNAWIPVSFVPPSRWQ